MRSKIILLLLILLLAIGFGSAAPLSAAYGAGLAARHEFVPGQLVVSLKAPPAKAPSQAAAVANGVNAQVSRSSGSLILLQFKNDVQAAQAISKLQADDRVAIAQRNYIYKIDPIVDQENLLRTGEFGPEMLEDDFEIEKYLPNDPKSERQWHLGKIQYFLTAPPEDNPPCIVVIDTGVNYNHPDLIGKVYKGYDFSDNDADPMDKNGHGTHVSGIAAAAANNKTGIAGVSPKSNILAIRVLDEYGSGTTFDVSSGISWANSSGAAECGGQEPLIYNLSLGGIDDATVNAAIATAVGMDRIVAAAAGNDNVSYKSGNYPGANPDTFSIASTEDNNHRSWFSNFDKPGNRWVHIAAPGSGVLSTYKSGYRRLSGTSMSTPLIAGAAARVWAKYPGMTAAEVQERLIATGVRGKGFPAKTKVVNLYRALGGNSRTIQGRVINAGTNKVVRDANITVKKVGKKGTLCRTQTNDSGFYTCKKLPKRGKYRVKVSKPGLVKTTRTFFVKKRRFNANLAVSESIGGASSGNWIITLLWEGQEPLTKVGKEFDLWLVDASNPFKKICYSAWENSTDGDPWNINIPSDSWGSASKTRMAEAGWIKKTYPGNTIEVWAVLWDHNFWPSKSRITDSGLTAVIYKDKQIVRKLSVPKLPKSTAADHWLIGKINLTLETFEKTNQIKSDGGLPNCITHE